MTLTHSPATVLLTYLVAEDVFSDPDDDLAWPLHLQHEPEDPDNCGTVYNTVGVKDGRLMNGTLIFKYGVQVRIRSQDFETGWTKCQEVEALLEAVDRNTTKPLLPVTEVSYLLENVSQQGPILTLGQEPAMGVARGTRRRFLFTINYLLTLKEE